MKNVVLIASLILLLPVFVTAQITPKSVMQNARRNCLAISNGKYELIRKFKFFSDKDTIVQSGEVVFEKNKTDDLFALHFWIENKTDSFARFYDGKQMYTVNHGERNVIIDTGRQSMYNGIRGNMIGNYLSFSYTDTLPMRALDDTGYRPVFDAAYNNKDTLVIFIPLSGNNDSGEWIRWFFDAKTYYPIAKEVRLVNDNEVQYEHFFVTAYSFNKQENIKWLKGKKWPSTYTESYRKPYVPPALLANETIAPDWVVETVTGDSIRFTDQKAKLYLIDFWYRACGPCVKAMPHLQALHEKYKDKGLQVIGLNPYDYKDKDTQPFKDFLSRRNVSYTLAFITIQVAAKEYNVSGYPTFYLVDADGKIVHSDVGFHENLEEAIGKIISNYLDSH